MPDVIHVCARGNHYRATPTCGACHTTTQPVCAGCGTEYTHRHRCS